MPPEATAPTLPAPKVCGRCAYFRQIATSQFGNCHGNPPSVETGPANQPISCRPQVLPADVACVLFSEK